MATVVVFIRTAMPAVSKYATIFTCLQLSRKILYCHALMESNSLRLLKLLETASKAHSHQLD